MKKLYIGFGYDWVQLRGGRFMPWWNAFSSPYEFQKARRDFETSQQSH